MAPRLKILMASGSKKGTQMYLFQQLNPPTRFPSRDPMIRDTHLQGILHISKGPNKNSSNKRAPRKKRPSMFPKSGATMEIDAHFWALLNIS
jgi:hypothetical protein